MRGRGAGDPAEAAALADRAETLLCDPRPAVRIGGLAALARLADVSPPHRAAAIGVLTAYLREPYDPEDHPPGERLVRRAALEVIRERLQDPAAPTTWCGSDIDLTGATLDGGSLTGIQLTGGSLRLARARLVSGTLDLTGIRIDGGILSLERSTIEGTLRLDNAALFEGHVSLDHAVLAGGTISLEHAHLTGGNVTLAGAALGSGLVSLRSTEVAGTLVSFHGATLSGARLDFASSTITSGGCYLTGLMMTAGEIVFREAEVARTAVSLRMSTLAGGSLDLDGLVPVDGPDPDEAATCFEGVYVIPPATVAWGPWTDAAGVVLDLRNDEEALEPVAGDAKPDDAATWSALVSTRPDQPAGEPGPDPS